MRNWVSVGLALWLASSGGALAEWQVVELPTAESAKASSAVGQGIPHEVSFNLAAASEQNSTGLLASKSADTQTDIQTDIQTGLIQSASLAKLDLHQGRVRLANTDGLELRFEQRLTAFGLELDDPAADSVFELSWFLDSYALGSQRFAPADLNLPDVTAIVDGQLSISSPVPFDRIELKEIHGRGKGDPEYISTVSVTANGSIDPNIAAFACQLPLGIAYNVAFAAGLIAVDPVNAAIADTAAYNANLALKFCKSVIEAPPDLTARVADGVCSKPAEQEHLMSEYENALGIPMPFTFEYDWGELGTPLVYHHNTEVEVSAHFGNPTAPNSGVLTDALVFTKPVPTFVTDATDFIFLQCRDDGSVAMTGPDSQGKAYACPYVAGRTIDFPVGRNTVLWRANTKMGPLDLVPLIVPGLPASAKLEPYRTIAENILKAVVQIGTDTYLLNGWRWGNIQSDFQRVTVYDEVPPTINPMPMDQTRITTSLVGDVIQVQIEADEPGGVSQRNYERILSKMYEVFDTCDRAVTFNAQYPTEALRSFWPVSTTAQDNTFTITWSAKDPGPNIGDQRNETITTMQVEVVDIRPPAIVPPPDIVEITTGTVNDLGQPLVFDFVDLDPTITNDATLPLGMGLHEVTWTATDASGNSTSAVQIVNIKTSNTDPNALAQTGANRQDAVSFEPTTIRLIGNDPDSDPLTFFIEQYPADGFFVAPLYPYFVEDYRLERATPSDAEILAGCGVNGSGPDYNLPAPTEPSYLTVNDAGETFVVDQGFIDCSTIPSPNGSFDRDQRIAIFDANGNLDSGIKFDRNLSDVIIDQENELIYATSKNGSSTGFVQVLDFDLNSVETYRLENMWARETRDCGGFDGTGNFCWIKNPDSSLLDANGVLYVMENTGRIYALDAVREPSNPVMWIADLSDDVDGGNAQTSVPADSLAIDSKGFIYASRNNRIYKYSPSTIGPDGLPYPGSLVGWMGRCDFDLAPGDEAVCDIANQRSIGYSCTDAICGIDPDIPQAERDFCGYTFSNDGNFGCRPGQLRGNGGIDIDPQDNLYVADRGNQRIQRFTPEGFFAGEAESACDGSCFVLGDFGSPRDVSVNSDHFYVLDPSTNLLHVSLLTPFTDVGPDWAELVYQSNNEFATGVDSFGFSVSDGIRHPDTGLPIRSAPATVQVEVSRNFRPPVATPGIASVVEEDVQTAIVLDGAELDPLDSLSFNLITPPENGTVTIVGDEARYLSNANYVGSDSFEFAAFDGNQESAPEAVAVTVLNVNDPPLVSAIDDATTGIGFTYRLAHDFSDPDTDEVHLLSIDWGDGTIEPEGERDAMGNATGPLLDEGDNGQGRITAEHIYTTTGAKTLEVCVTDQIDDSGGTKLPTPNSLVDCTQATINVIDAVDLVLSVTPSSDTVLPGQFLSYDVEVLNLTPDAGSGQSASNVRLSIELARELEPGSVSGAGCSGSGLTVNCNFGTLAVGATGTVSITTQVPPDIAKGVLLQTKAEATLNESDQTPQNELLLTTPVLRPADYYVGASGDALLDKPDVDTGDNICASEDGVCTLRAAIQQSEATAGSQTIALGNGVYSLTEGALPSIADNLIILGNGPGQTFIDAGGAGAVLGTAGGATSLRIEDLTLTGSDGPALDVNKPTTVRRVRFTNNYARSFFGGGILNSSQLDLRDVTFDGNRSDNDGGAVFNITGASSTMVNVTAVGNVQSAFAFADGIHSLTNVTIVGNTGGCCWDAAAAALNVYGAGTEVTITNSALIGNRIGPVGGAPNCVALTGGQLISGGNNLFGDLTGCDITLQSSDQTADDALLFPASNNGGGLPTLKPRIASLLVDNGNPNACPATDARGVARPADGNDDGNARCDIGAFELRNDRLFSSGFE